MDDVNAACTTSWRSWRWSALRLWRLPAYQRCVRGCDIDQRGLPSTGKSCYGFGVRSTLPMITRLVASGLGSPGARSGSRASGGVHKGRTCAAARAPRAVLEQEPSGSHS